MQLNDLGKKIKEEWLKTILIRPDMNLELAEYVIMPNHFHAILIIGDNKYNTPDQKSDYLADDKDVDKAKNKFGSQSKNLASVIRGFKSAVTTFARKENIRFDWQPRFHDHIITTEQEYLYIAEYIINNPNNWQKDKFYK